MKPASQPSADDQVAQALTKLRDFQKVFALTPTCDVPFSTPVSHVREYQDDATRLRRYGNQVIGNRSLQFAMLTAIKAHWNIQMYLDGVNAANPLALPAAARAQIELFALAWHVDDVIVSNAGFMKPDLATRMLAIDEALIMAIHGTRAPDLMEIYQRNELSKLRATNARDLETFRAKNILTRIKKAEGGSEYKSCNDDYDRLSELLHPNGAQNLIFMAQSPNGEGWFRLGISDPQYLRRAQYQSAHAMVNASAEILRMVSGVPEPFSSQD